jgi:transposase
MRTKKFYYIGLDVHKDSIWMAVMVDEKDTPIESKQLSNNYMKVVKTLAPYQEKGKVQVAYEAGCLGYGLQRHLSEFGFDCRVIPPTRVVRPGLDKRVKTDKRDAALIANMLKRREGESINIPTREDEAGRDLLRCRSDFKDDLKRAKQRLLNFLLRHDMKYESNRYWTIKHRKWMAGLKFGLAVDKMTYEYYLSYIENTEERIARVDEEIRKEAENERNAEKTRILRAFRGIDYVTALSFISEVGDFRRFATAQSFMCYLGLVPSEYSSGKKIHRGPITKTGNSHLRKLLVESAWHYTRPVKESKRLAERRIGTREQVITYADKAISRLHGKYYKMLSRGKVQNIAVTSVARELAGFIWGVMNMAA